MDTVIHTIGQMSALQVISSTIGLFYLFSIILRGVSSGGKCILTHKYKVVYDSSHGPDCHSGGIIDHECKRCKDTYTETWSVWD